MSKKSVSTSQTLKIDEIFNTKGWDIDSKTVSLYKNYIHRFSTLPDETKDFFFDLTERFENISTLNQISTLFREGYNSLDKEKIDNARKIYFLPLIVPELGYEKVSKYRFINWIYKVTGYSKKTYKERPPIKSCDKMITLLEIEYRDMYGSDKFIFPKKYSIFKNQYDKKKDVIILVDDFVGTGETADEILDFFINTEKHNYNNNIKILTLISQKKGVSLIKEKYNIEVLNAKTQDASITSYYGDEVELKKQIVEKMSKSINIKKDFFGYKDSEALVCILNKSPNNTLPIFWYETKTNPAPFPRMKVYKYK
jgi:hypothetical protein